MSNTIDAGSPSSTDRWIATFEAATDKAAVATQWMDAFLTSTRRRGVSIETELYEGLKTRLRGVRSMVLAIPRGHAVLTGQHQGKDTQLTAWLRSYFDVDQRPGLYRRASQWALDDATIVRDMWLQPQLHDRKDALLKLSVSKQKYANLDFLDVILRAAWDVAEADGNSNETISKATALTLCAFNKDARYQFAQTRSRYPLFSAIQSSFETIKDSPSMFATKPTEKTRILSKYPAVCVMVLKDTDAHTLHIEQYSQDRFDSLSEWLPRFADVVLLSQSMGMSYEATLDQIEVAIKNNHLLPGHATSLDSIAFE
jgi:hypothetical protein